MIVYTVAASSVDAARCIVNGQYRELADEYIKQPIRMNLKLFKVTIEEHKPQSGKEKKREHILD